MDNDIDMAGPTREELDMFDQFIEFMEKIQPYIHGEKKHLANNFLVDYINHSSASDGYGHMINIGRNPQYNKELDKKLLEDEYYSLLGANFIKQNVENVNNNANGTKLINNASLINMLKKNSESYSELIYPAYKPDQAIGFYSSAGCNYKQYLNFQAAKKGNNNFVKLTAKGEAEYSRILRSRIEDIQAKTEELQKKAAKLQEKAVKTQNEVMSLRDDFYKNIVSIMAIFVAVFSIIGFNMGNIGALASIVYSVEDYILSIVAINLSILFVLTSMVTVLYNLIWSDQSKNGIMAGILVFTGFLLIIIIGWLLCVR